MQSATEKDYSKLIRTISSELDMRQLAILAKLTPQRRLEMMFELCDFAHDLVIASERQRKPVISEEELYQRVKARIQLSYDS
ncbi:MAG: hypothetical protein KIT87_09295 [Anaerolineae bacterium]|nr:hypothetical protein [Anaerolineae bacterium]